MELGKGRLRKVGINNLTRAVHPHHGVMWTDGRGIYLAPLHVEGRQMQNATSVRLGEFDTVTSVHWSNPLDQGEGDGTAPSCHMAVVHQNNVSVWRVSGALPKLSFKQVRKINVRPIAQGCLWNPISDALCLLSRHQCSFYFRHDNNKGSHAVPPLESGKITCGCWSSDGKKLIVCVGSSLLVYRWPEISNGVSDEAIMLWSVPGLAGEITSVTSMPKNNIVLATEVPLDSLCRKKENQDAFVMPDGVQSNASGDDDVIRPAKSATQSLMNLQTNTQLNESSSSLVLVRLHEGNKDPTKAFACPVNGLLTPDILLFEKSSQCVVVGSNSQSQLQIYALLEKRLAFCGDIQLDKSQRPKGLCSVPTYFDERGAALLILVGQRAVEDSGILSSSTEAEFQLSLKYIIIKAGYQSKSKDSSSSHGDSFKSRSTTNVHTAGAISKSESMRERVPSGGEGRLRLRSGSGMSEINLAAPQSPPAIDEVNGGGVKAQGRQSPSARESSKLSLLNASPSSHRPSPSPSLLVQQTPAPPHTLTSPLSPLHQKPPPVIQDLSDQNGSALTKEELEVETVSFSSQPPSFSNKKLSGKYELNDNGSRRRNNSVKEKSTSNSTLESVKPSTNQQRRNDSGTLSSSSNPNLQRNEQQQAEWLASSSQSENSMTEPSNGDSPRLKSQQGHGQIAEPIKSPRHKGKRDSTSIARENAKTLSNGQSKEDVTSDLGSSLHSADSSFDSMEKQVKHQKDNIEALYRRLEELSMTVKETSMVFPAKYQDISTPELVTITCVKQDKKTQVSKQFLLDNGRLQLEPVKLAFGLATVELWLDGIPIVLGANIDGYIPLKFSPSSSLRISGIPADTLPPSLTSETS